MERIQTEAGMHRGRRAEQPQYASDPINFKRDTGGNVTNVRASQSRKHCMPTESTKGEPAKNVSSFSVEF
jgi:hypothetical protein